MIFKKKGGGDYNLFYLVKNFFNIFLKGVSTNLKSLYFKIGKSDVLIIMLKNKGKQISWIL